MTIEIGDLPIKNGDFPVRYNKLPEGTGIFFGHWLYQVGLMPQMQALSEQ